MKRLVSLILVFVLCLSMCNTNASALSKLQKQRADRIANICIHNWKEYGVLPSVCVGQAMEESGLGTSRLGKRNNLWGIRGTGSAGRSPGGFAYYSSFDEGVYKHMKTINDECYKNAPFCKNYGKQLRLILKGGYCQPAGDYYSDVTGMIQKYGWDKYDKKLFKKLKKEKQERIRKRKAKQLEKSRKKKQRAIFKVVYDSNVPINEAWVSNKVSKQNGTVQIKSVDDMEYYEIYDLKVKNIPDNEIHVNYTVCKDVNVKLEFIKGAKG